MWYFDITVCVSVCHQSQKNPKEVLSKKQMIFPALHRAKKTGIKIRYYDYIFGVSKWIIGNAMLGCLDNHFPDDEKHQSSGLLE